MRAAADQETFESIPKSDGLYAEVADCGGYEQNFDVTPGLALTVCDPERLLDFWTGHDRREHPTAVLDPPGGLVENRLPLTVNRLDAGTKPVVRVLRSAKALRVWASVTLPTSPEGFDFVPRAVLFPPLAIAANSEIRIDTTV
jgi:hypothetical protein